LAKKCVAIVLSGGISLGAYTAGVLDELLRAFFTASDEYEIDIITGASAGAVNAALVAYGLLYKGGNVDLYKFWTELIDINDMLVSNTDKSEPLSLLDSIHLLSTIEYMLGSRTAEEPVTRSVLCSRQLTLAATITNTTALPYPSNNKLAIQHRNSEQETFYLDAATLPSDKLWQRIARVALASLTIPFIFPLVSLQRHVGEDSDDRQYIHKPVFQGLRRFWYFDGGMFSNLPLDLALYHCHKDERSPKDRIVIIVNGWQNEFVLLKNDPIYPTLAAYMLSLHGAIKRENTAWQINTAINSANILIRNSDTREIPIENASSLEDMPEVSSLGYEALASLVFISPRQEDGPLKGLYLHTLSGLFDQRFRQYDFQRGSADGRRVATEVLGIPYSSDRPREFYLPNENPSISYDISHYSALRGIRSTRNPNRTVLDIFEDALDVRLAYLINRVDLSSLPTLFVAAIRSGLLTPLIKRNIHRQLDETWSYSS